MEKTTKREPAQKKPTAIGHLRTQKEIDYIKDIWENQHIEVSEDVDIRAWKVARDYTLFGSL